MNSNPLQAERSALRRAPPEVVTAGHPPLSDTSLKKRLTERFSVHGALVACCRRTFFGTWKACGRPLPVYDLGMGGMNFWNAGKPPKPGTKIKLTLLVPKVDPIDLFGVVIWSKAMPHSDDRRTRQYSHITGVKFVEYNARVWEALCRIHRMVVV